MSEKILIVEDNKTLAKLIAKKIQTSLGIEVDVAYTLAEAKLFIARYTYFVTLLDINLPDAPNGEIVDYVTKKKIHAMVLSGNIDKEFRKKILKKNIIDYVNKSGVDDINYIIHTIQRLQNNQKHKVLVVDDSRIFRQQMQTMLENLFFNVISVAHGEEAIGMLQAQPDISLVLTDYHMPVMDGLELTIQIRKTYTKNELCILALSSNEDEEITALFLKHGANDYVKKPFSKEEFSCRVNNSIEALENIQMITNYANRDYLTGLYNRRYFFETINEYIDEIKDSGEKFSIGMIDIDHFKKINDTYGHDVGDKVITALADILRSSTNPHDVVARFGGEEFCVVLKNINQYSAHEIFNRLREEAEKFSFHLKDEQYINFSVSIGALLFNEEESLEENINAADMLLYKAKDNGRDQVVFEA
ncbi:GGDEF domain-containing response regulator [Sulfurimonas autotrophica]|uniref:diguanylate cyclase n=1 Tax=Sulfurimonas autotrophica (strain ATCC BAA-671 / DSM 16294 / JCM 11897 / OK10) TaxID=563040 RepID=E0UUW2_SULAO|nr:diguanylate cyclase [Sulfurimonas autotrophica]ADN08474.1 response regulator receiver modulated diguanylate cyclase [Sulfurimonas autotrophica DSM 16294]